ncbi:hypothetical protein ACM614_15180 [Streptomyces sp. 12297]
MQIHGDDEARATGPDGRLTTEDLAHSGAADEPGSSGRAPAYPGEATSGPDAPTGPDDGTRAERDAETRDADEETEGTPVGGHAGGRGHADPGRHVLRAQAGAGRPVGPGEQVATEDLRLALQHYRSFFNRLLRT